MEGVVLVYLWWLFSHVFLQPVSAEVIQCTVTQDDSGTHYSVPEFQATGCYYSWSNSTYVLGTHEGKMDKVVVTKSNRTLLTYVCSELMYYMRDCISEGTPRTATCTSNCTGNPGLLNHSTEIPSYTIVIIVVSIVLVLLGLCFLYHKVRGPICSCNQTRCVYTAVKMQNRPPNTTDVEATG